jgi:hypothetical protein
MPNEYEKLQREIAVTPERPAVVIHGDGTVTEHPPLAQDDSEYGRSIRAMRAEPEASLEVGR